MKYAFKILSLTSTMVSVLSAAEPEEQPGGQIRLRDLPVEMLGRIVYYATPAEQIKLRLAGDPELNSKIQKAMEADVRSKVNKCHAHELYGRLPVDKTDIRGVYNLIHYADIVLQTKPLQRPDVIDFLVALDINAAIKMKYLGLFNGVHGYKQNVSAVNTFIEEQTAKGNQWAIKMKIKGLLNGHYGYQKDIAAAHNLIDDQIAKGNIWAIEKKFWGLHNEVYGYQKDIAAAQTFIEDQSATGNQWATDMKIEGLLHGWYGYEQDETAAHTLIEEQCVKGNQLAVELKCDGLLEGHYGYQKDEAVAHALIEEKISNGNQWAIDKKVDGLLWGNSGYRKNLADPFLEEHRAKVNQSSTENETQRLLDRICAYQTDPQPVLRYFGIRIISFQAKATGRSHQEQDGLCCIS